MENNNMIKEVDAVLKMNEAGEEIIEIKLNGSTYSLNFTKEDQSYLRDFFKVCILELLKNEFELVLKKDDSVKNEIIVKVSEDYINDLNKELKICISEITKKTNNL